MKKTFAVITCAAALLATTTLSAQTTRTPGASPEVTNPAGAAADRMAPTTDRMSTEKSTTAQLTPVQFVQKAAVSDKFEVHAGTLAAEKATRADVKAFAREMVTAHTESTAKIMTAAKGSSIKIDADVALDDMHAAKLADLRAANGTAFDREYIAQQITAHEQAAALMRNYAQNGTDSRLKTAAGEILPVVEKHLAHVKRLEKTTNVSSR